MSERIVSVTHPCAMTSKVVKCNNCNIVICELLAFIQNKIDVMSEESIVRICTTSFSADEVELAKSLLFDSIKTTKRKISRKRLGGHTEIFMT